MALLLAATTCLHRTAAVLLVMALTASFAAAEGPMKGPDGKEIPPTGQSFEVDFCTVARWDQNGQIIEENLFYDLVTFMKQIGVGG